MSDSKTDNFEEFLRESLENYNSPDSPNWTEMENRLDEVTTGVPQVVGLLSRTSTKWIAGIVAIGGITVMLTGLLVGTQEVTDGDDNTSSISFFDRIRALTIDYTSTDDDVNEDGLTDSNGPNRAGATDNNQMGLADVDLLEKDESDVVFKKQVPPVYSEPSGHNYSMLRAAEASTPSPQPDAAFSADIAEGCVPLKVNFDLSSSDIGMKYFWNFGDGTYSIEDSPEHIYRETGTYAVELTVTSVINQKSVKMLGAESIIAHAAPEVGFNWDNDENEAGHEVTFIDLSDNVVKWYWNFGDRSPTSEEQHPTHTYGKEDTYTVSLVGIDANGCKDTLYSTIRISGKQLSHNFFAPTAFTPNGDGSNDEFIILINGPQTLAFEMSIYNRQGLLVFETNDINQAWDGRLKSGELAAQGPYIWMVTMKDEKGNHDQQRGLFTLIK